MVVIREYKLFVRGGVLGGRNFLWKELVSYMLNLFCFKFEGNIFLSEDINE